MKLSNYIVLSIVFHTIVLLMFRTPINKKIDSLVSQKLIVSFAKVTKKEIEINSNHYVAAIPQPINVMSHEESTVTKTEVESDFDEMVTNQHENNTEEYVNETQYFLINEVDIKALPISNIDISMIANIQRTGLPVKLRIYINLFGKVDTIERLSNLEQDEEFLARLEYLLKKTTFLPAKKDGTSVNSVQDVEFSI